jgi:hypothetical protein
MKVIGFDFSEKPERPSSEELAQAWRPYIEPASPLLGRIARCSRATSPSTKAHAVIRCCGTRLSASLPGTQPTKRPRCSLALPKRLSASGVGKPLAAPTPNAANRKKPKRRDGGHINQSAIQRRARELAERDGFTWQLEYSADRPGTMLPVQSYLSPAHRQQYLDRAVAELRGEADSA